MAKGIFSQGIVIFLSQVTTLNAVRGCLADGYNVLKEVAASDDWQFGGPSLVIEYDSRKNGLVSVDLVEQVWPDHMGDAKNETTLFGAWAMGHFAPYAYPNGLRRATEQSWRWDEGASAVARHSAFIRIRSSYAFGAPTDAPVLPSHYDPIDELNFITGIAEQLLLLPEAICYFNPGGEVILAAESLRETTQFANEHGLPALDAWCNIRMFNLENDWLLMDTVGNWQLDVADQEAAFPKDLFSPQEVDRFLRNVSLYALKQGDVIKDGDTMDGPGGVAWKGHGFENGVSDPPRRVLRWLPVNAMDVPAILIPKSGSIDEGRDGVAVADQKKPLWKPW